MHFDCNLWFLIHLSFNSQQGPPLSGLSCMDHRDRRIERKDEDWSSFSLLGELKLQCYGFAIVHLPRCVCGGGGLLLNHLWGQVVYYLPSKLLEGVKGYSHLNILCLKVRTYCRCCIKNLPGSRAVKLECWKNGKFSNILSILFLGGCGGGMGYIE